MAVSGALCGVAGFLLVSGTDHTINTGTVGGMGFTAIMVSWLAKFNPILMTVASFLIVFLERGAGEIATAFQLNESVSDILTGIILFFIISLSTGLPQWTLISSLPHLPASSHSSQELPAPCDYHP